MRDIRSGGNLMSSSQRVSRGFHRLGLFMAAITLVVGSIASLNIASDIASNAARWHDEQATLACAQEAFHKKFYADLSRKAFERRMATKLEAVKTGEVTLTHVNLKELGCSEWSERVPVLTIFTAKPPGEFSWTVELWSTYALYVVYALAVSLAVYGIVCAIGWVIGAFAAS